jgi:hypothetical protein
MGLATPFGRALIQIEAMKALPVDVSAAPFSGGGSRQGEAT